MTLTAQQNLHPMAKHSHELGWASRNANAILWCVIVIAFIVRIAAIVGLSAWKNPSSMEHRSIAISLLNGDGFSFGDWGLYGPSSVQSPIYPLFLAGLYKVFGTDGNNAHICAMIINAFFGALSCWLVYKMVRVIKGPTVVALISAALMAIWPTQIYAVTVVQAVAMITCGTIAVIWLFYSSIDSRSIWPWLAYSLIGCACALTEPVLLPFMALSGLIILAWPTLPMSFRVRNAAILFLTALVVLAPWSYRNFKIHGQLVPVKSTFWVNVWKGNNPNASGTDRVSITPEMLDTLSNLTEAQRRDPTFDSLRQYDLLTPEQRQLLTGKDEAERERVFARFAKDWINAHPDNFIGMCVRRFVLTVWYEWNNPKSSFIYIASRTALLILTPIGLFLAWRAGFRLFIPLLVVGLMLLTYTLTVTAARFAIPMEPFQLAMSAVVIAGLLVRLRVLKPHDLLNAEVRR